jgi:hypothetical protein
MNAALFAADELRKLGTAEPLLSLVGGRYLTLDRWLVPMTRFAESREDERGIRVRARAQVLSIEVPRQPFDDPTAFAVLRTLRLTEEADPYAPSASGQLQATLTWTQSDGGQQSVEMETELLYATGRLRLWTAFDTPAMSMEVMDALHTGDARVKLQLKHVIPVQEEERAPPPDRLAVDLGRVLRRVPRLGGLVGRLPGHVVPPTVRPVETVRPMGRPVEAVEAAADSRPRVASQGGAGSAASGRGRGGGER